MARPARRPARPGRPPRGGRPAAPAGPGPRRAPAKGRSLRFVGPWLHGAVPVVGIIGGIGAGKSRLAAALAERGAQVLDADAIGHALIDQAPAREQVLARFGRDILDPEQPVLIDRKVLGKIVFSDPRARHDLEAILHPRMRRTFEKAIARVQRRRTAPAIVLDAAILLEAGWDELCDLVVFVDAPRELRLARVSESRGWSAEQLEIREQAQWPLDQKRAAAGTILHNGTDTKRFETEVTSLWARLRARKRRTPTGRSGPPGAAPTGPEPGPGQD